MKNKERIEISKAGDINLEGLDIEILAFADGTFRGINIREITKEGKIQRKVFVSSIIEFEKLTKELVELVIRARKDEIEK